MQIAAAHAGCLHLDDHVMGIRSGIGELHQFQSAFAREHNAAHRYLRFLACGLILNAKILIGKVRTGSDLA